MRRSTKKKSKSNSGTATVPGPGTGDIPPGPRSDVVTRSVALPRATSRLCFHQHAPPVTVTASNSGVTSGVLTFALSGLDGSGTLTSLFDFYRISAIRVSVRPQNNAIGVVDPTVTRLVEFYNVIDYNDGTAPGTTTSIREYDNCVVLLPGETCERTFQPRMSAPVRSAAGTDYMSVVPQWLNTGSDDVIHYGLKYLVPQVNVAQTILQTWQIDIEYWVEFSKVVG